MEKRVDTMTRTTVDAEVRDLGARWAAELAGDTDALGSLVTDDFVGVGPLGYRLTKRQWLGRYTSGDLANPAIAVGIQRQQAAYQRRPANGRFWVTQLLIQGDNGWRIAGLHLSPLADQPPPPRPS
jgi:hypothetical protein